MTIQANIPTTIVTSYSGLRSSASESKAINVSFDIDNISYFNGSDVVANFRQTISGDKLDGLYSFQFAYSGSGNPIDQAEEKLKEYFTKLGYTS